MKRYVLLSLLLISLSVQSRSLKDSLLLVIQNATHDSVRCTALNTLVNLEPSSKESMNYYDQLIVLAKKNIDYPELSLRKYFHESLAMAMNNKATVLHQMGDLIEALEIYEACHDLMIRINDKTTAAIILNNMGAIYDSQGDLIKALEYFQKSVKEMEVIGEKSSVASSYCNIGNVHRKLRNLPLAMEYYNKSMVIFKKNNDSVGISNAFNYQASVYQQEGKDSLALDHFNKSFNIRRILDKKLLMAQSLNNIGDLLADGKQLVSAINYFKESLVLYEVMNDIRGISNTSDNMAQALMEMGKYDEALQWARKGMEGSKKFGSPLMIRNSSLTLRKILSYLGKYKEAYEMFELQMKMKDSLDNKDNRKAAYKKDIQFHYEKKEAQMKAEREKEKAVNAEKLLQKERERNYFVAGSLLLVLFALYVLRGYRQKKKDNLIIRTQKELVETKQKELLDSINYAKRIQLAHMPGDMQINRLMERSGKRIG